MSLTDLRIRELSELLMDRSVSSLELLNSYLNIALKGCCITFCDTLAFEMAKEVDERRSVKGTRTAIEGLPFSMKDNIKTCDVTTTCNSRSLKLNKPGVNARITDNLINAGAVLAAKNCMREFSVGRIEDSAYELRNYFDLAATNKNVNIGAFSIGTDLGLNEYYCEQWTFKPSLCLDELSEGIITGAPSLERITATARKADDLLVLYPYIYSGLTRRIGCCDIEKSIVPSEIKILVYDNLNMPGYIFNFFSAAGFDVSRCQCDFKTNADIIYDFVLSTEFFTNMENIGMPDNETNPYYEIGFTKFRTENIGFEVKQLIITGAHLLSKKNCDKTRKVLEARSALKDELLSLLDKYDFIAAPAIFGDKLAKAAALSGLAEITVPYADVLAFKIYTRPEKEQLLMSLCGFLGDLI